MAGRGSPVWKHRQVLFGLWMVVLTLVYFLMPGWHLVTWSAICVSTITAIIQLIQEARTRYRWPGRPTTRRLK